MRRDKDQPSAWGCLEQVAHSGLLLTVYQGTAAGEFAWYLNAGIGSTGQNRPHGFAKPKKVGIERFPSGEPPLIRHALDTSYSA